MGSNFRSKKHEMQEIAVYKWYATVCCFKIMDWIWIYLKRMYKKLWTHFKLYSLYLGNWSRTYQFPENETKLDVTYTAANINKTYCNFPSLPLLLKNILYLAHLFGIKLLQFHFSVYSVKTEQVNKVENLSLTFAQSLVVIRLFRSDASRFSHQWSCRTKSCKSH